MGFVIKELIENFIYVLLPMFMVQMFFLAKYTQRSNLLKNWMLGFFPLLSIILCMLFPAVLSEGFIVDFRRIPFVLGVLYGGVPYAIGLLAVILGIRFAVGGAGFFVALVIYPLLTVGLLFIAKRYKQMSFKKRLLVNVIVIPVTESTGLFIATLLLPLPIPLANQLFFFVLNVTGMLVVLLIWEAITRNFSLIERINQRGKLETVSHLAASMSHEVRNPLTVARGFIQMMLAEKDETKRNQYGEISLYELDRANDIISDYLTFAKPSKGEMRTLLLEQEVRQAVNVLNPYSRQHKVICTVEESDEPFLVQGDPSKLEQALVNIIKNSIESSEEGDRVTISFKRKRQSAVVSIRDTGSGMSEEQLKRLGEPYFTTKTKGTGLGLMVTYSIIAGMDGTIGVASTAGEGTTFSITLPLTEK